MLIIDCNLVWNSDSEVTVDDILEFVGFKMFSIKSPKVNEIHESLPKAWELNIDVLLNRPFLTQSCSVDNYLYVDDLIVKTSIVFQ